MIEISDYVVVGWEHAIRGMRNPKNSWDKSDSGWVDFEDYDGSGCSNGLGYAYVMGENDLKLANVLANGGPVHAKYRRMIAVYVDVNAPLYWWKEFDTYKVGTVADSCSTMHKIHAKEFEPIDFSTDRLTQESMACINTVLAFLNENRDRFNNAEKLDGETDEEFAIRKKSYWEQMIQLLPSSYNQKRTLMLNYEVLKNIYTWRKDHKLTEWMEFCKWIESLPYAKEIILTE